MKMLRSARSYPKMRKSEEHLFLHWKKFKECSSSRVFLINETPLWDLENIQFVVIEYRLHKRASS